MKGLGVSPGIGIGKVLIFNETEMQVERKKVLDTKLEIERFNSARSKAVLEIDRHRELTLERLGKSEADIFSAHIMILEDPEIISAVTERIKAEEVNAEYAFSEVVDHYISIFNSVEDEYFKAKSDDLKDVFRTVLRIMMNIKSTDLMQIDEKSIIVSKELTPSDIAHMNKEMVAGIVTEHGGRTSHVAILARTLEIPVVSGLENITSKVNQGDYAIINGNTGDVLINPSKQKELEYQSKIKKEIKFKNKLKSMKYNESISKDGFKVKVVGNIGVPEDIDKVLEYGGEGVGLYRTEFLYMDRDRLPSEEEQFEAYRGVAERLENKPLIIRTLDIGGDKELPYLRLPDELNPFLGYRAIRLCLDRPDIFKPQLRAILRASAYGNVKVMFPMISSIQEVRDIKTVIDEVKGQLRQEDKGFNENIEIGIMVETPAVAIHSRAFAREVDFFSIGTNDLIQYTLAVDRGNHKIAHLYNQFHPAVLQLIKMTIENGHKEGIWVGLCGEAAGDQRLIPLLLGMGLDEFSVAASSILETKYLISKTSKKEMASKMDFVLNLPNAVDIEKFLNEVQSDLI